MRASFQAIVINRPHNFVATVAARHLKFLFQVIRHMLYHKYIYNQLSVFDMLSMLSC